MDLCHDVTYSFELHYLKNVIIGSGTGTISTFKEMHEGPTIAQP